MATGPRPPSGLATACRTSPTPAPCSARPAAPRGRAGGVPTRPDPRAVPATAGGTGPPTTPLDPNAALRSLTFNSTGTYTVVGSGANTLTIAANPATPAVLVNAGNHTISA